MWFWRLFRLFHLFRRKSRQKSDLLGNPLVPISYRILYLTADEAKRKKVEELYEQDLDEGYFGGRV